MASQKYNNYPHFSDLNLKYFTGDDLGQLRAELTAFLADPSRKNYRLISLTVNSLSDRKRPISTFGNDPILSGKWSSALLVYVV